ncbi:hypothetical protein BJ165DRAFT_1533991 [Panaeolus papilionaceus]|nr:hypothetical protein BJ165DRAFT_1533991 [Panaeolus papilionaceus]
MNKKRYTTPDPTEEWHSEQQGTKLDSCRQGRGSPPVNNEPGNFDANAILEAIDALTSAFDKNTKVQIRQADALETLVATIDHGISSVTGHLAALSEATQDFAVLQAAHAGIPPDVFQQTKEYGKEIKSLALLAREALKKVPEDVVVVTSKRRGSETGAGGHRAEVQIPGPSSVRRATDRQIALEKKTQDKDRLQKDEEQEQKKR